MQLTLQDVKGAELRATAFIYFQCPKNYYYNQGTPCDNGEVWLLVYILLFIAYEYLIFSVIDQDICFVLICKAIWYKKELEKLYTPVCSQLF